jgi:hypothetical protein
MFFRNRQRAQKAIDKQQQRIFDPIPRPLANSKPNKLRTVPTS